MAGLYDAVGANRFPTINMQDVYAAQPRATADEAVALDAANTPTLVRGLRMGLRGMASGVTGFGAGMLEATGSPAADEWYAAAREQARQAELQGPRVQRWADVHDPASFGEYALGQFGAAAPMLAPAVGTATLANAVRLSPAATMFAGAAPMQPVLAGGAMVRMKDDPVSAEVDPARRAAIANAEGLGAAALLGAVPGYMSARALGRPGAAAAPSLNPLRTAGGIAADTALSAGAQGAAGVGAGEIGRAVQSSLNPDAVVPEGTRMEEFASNALGALPMVAPLAVSGRTLGPYVEPGKHIGGVALDKAKDVGSAAVDLAKQGAEKLAPGVAAGKQALDDAVAAAREGRSFAEVAAVLDGKDADEARIRGVGAGAEAFAENVAEPLGRWSRKLYDRATESADNFTTRLREEYAKRKSPPSAEEFKADLHKMQGEALRDLNTFVKQLGEEFPALKELNAAWEKGPLSSANAGKLNVAAQALAKLARSKDKGELFNDAPEAPKTDGQFSKGRDKFYGTIRDALTELGFDKDTVHGLATRLRAADVRRMGVTRSVREAIDALGVTDPEAKRLFTEGLTPLVKSLKDEHLPDVHEQGTDFTVEQFSKEIGPVMEEMLDASDLDLTPRERSNAVRAVTEFITRAANGEKDAARNMPKFMAREFGRFGDTGKAAMEKIRAAAKVVLGEKSAQYKNVVRELDTMDQSTAKVAQLRDYLSHKPLGENLDTSVLPIAERMRADMDFVERRTQDAAQRLSRAKVLLKAYEERAAQTGAPEDAANVIEARKFVAAAEARGYGDMKAQLKKEWANLVAAKDFDKAFDLIEEYRSSDLVPRADTKGVNDTAATRAAPTDETDPQAAAIRAYERGEEDRFIDPETGETRELTEEEQYSVDKKLADAGLHGGEENNSEYVGQRSLTGEAHDDMVPLDVAKSADYEDGMAQHVYDSGEYAHRLTDARQMTVQEWAEDRSLSTGEGMHELLNRALKEQVRADEARRSKVAALAGDKNVKQTLDRIDARLKLAKRLMKNPDRAGYTFFNDGIAKTLKFIKVEQSDAGNLKLTMKDLERASLPDGVQAKGYGTMSARRDKQFPASAFEGALLPVKMADGTTLHVDIAKLVARELKRHQAGDIVGVGDKKAPAPAADQRVAPVQQHTPQEIHAALMNTLATIQTMKGVADDAFGARLGTGKLQTGVAGKRTEVPYLDTSLVVLRDPVNNYTWTVGRLTGRGGVDLGKTYPVKDTKPIDAAALKGIVKLNGSTTAEAFSPVVSDRRTSSSVKGKRDPKLLDVQAKAERGVLSQRLEKGGKFYDLDARSLIKHVAERYDIDFGEMTRDSDTPNGLLAELYKEGLVELEAQGFKLVEAGKEVSTAWNDAQVMSKDFTANDDIPKTGVAPLDVKKVTLWNLESFLGKGEAATQVVPRTMPRNLDAAKIAAKKKDIAKLEDVLGEWKRQEKAGEFKVSAATERATSATKLEALLRSLDFLTKYFDPTDGKPKALKYRSMDTDNSRIAQMLYELGNRDAPSFDKATQRLYFDAAETLGGTRLSEMIVRRDAKLPPLATDGPSTKKGEFVPPSSTEKIVWPKNVNPPPPAAEPGPKLPATEGMPAARIAYEKARAKQPRPPMTPEPAAPAKPAKPVKEGDWSGLTKKGYPKKEFNTEAAPVVPEAPAPAPKPAAPSTELSKLAAESVLEDLAVKDMPGAGKSAAILKALDAETIREVALALPPSKSRTPSQTQFANVLARQFEQQMRAAGLTYDKASNSFFDAGDTSFSKARTGEGPKDPARTIKFLHEDWKSMLGELAKLDLVDDKIKVTKPDGTTEEVVGVFTKATEDAVARAVVSLMAEDQRGAVGHEAWHAVRDLLEASGERYKTLLDTISRAVDTPMMRAWLERTYANDEGALSQIRESSLERESFAFQAFRNGKPMPLLPETRSIWKKIGDWLNGVLKKIGFDFTSDTEQANNFFKYVSDGGYLRDHNNPAAVMNALGRTHADKFKETIKSFQKPLEEGMDIAVGHTAERIDKMGNEHYTAVRKMFEGERGKAGYNMWRRMALQRFDNVFTDFFKDAPTREERMKLVGTPRYEALMNQLADYAAPQMTRPQAHAVMRDAYAVDTREVSARMEEFLSDLKQFGGVPKEMLGGDPGALRDIAARYADEGIIHGLVPFKDSPEHKAKWETTDPLDQIGRKIEALVNKTERIRAFGENDKLLNDALEKGDKLASVDEQRFMEKAVKAYEHRLGHADMSPATKKLMSAIVVANNVRLLPFALFSQMIDPMKIAFRKNEMNAVLGSLFSGIAQLPRSFKKIDSKWTASEWEKLAKEIGTAAPIASMLSDMHTGFHIPGKTGKLNDLFFRYTGQESWNRAMTIEATKHAVEFIRHHTGQSKDFKTTEHSERFLKELGLTADDVKFKEDGMPVRNEKIDRAIMQFVHEAMAYPDPGSNTLWMNDARFALLSQMKRFLFAHNRYILERGEREWEQGNKWVLLPYLSAVPMMLVADTMRDAANFMSDEAYKKNWDFTDHLMHAYERTGAMGRGQLLQDAIDNVKRGGSGIEGVMGPSFEAFADLIGQRGSWQDVSFAVDAVPEVATGAKAISRARGVR